MIVFESILVPLDFSPHSAEALRLATDMACQNSARLTLVHVLDPLGYGLAESDTQPERRQELFNEADKSLAAAKRSAEAAGVRSVEARTLEGAVPSSLADFARKAGVDLIVLGTHGRTGLRRALLGSVAEALVRSAPCPVLTVRLDKDADVSSLIGARASAQ